MVKFHLATLIRITLITRVTGNNLMRILLLEEDATLRQGIAEKLTASGYVYDSVDSFSDGQYYMDIRYYDLVVADWGLVEGKGFIAAVRDGRPKTSIIVLSECGDTQSEIIALREGADDYLRKPFDIDVLFARVDSALRRYRVKPRIEIGDLIIDTNEEMVSYQGRTIDIKGKVFEVFAYLANHRNTIVSKEQLLDAIWIEPELVTPQVIDVAIDQIRKKIDKPLGIVTIETVHRRGYRFCYSG